MKRKVDQQSADGALISRSNTKRTRKAEASTKRKGKEPAREDTTWPEYFTDLFKVFKALNTVLAFVSSRKHLATTFPVVRSSVERLLKRPLDLVKVAELKALLPDLIQFAYIPANNLRIHKDSQSQTPRSGRKGSPDYSIFSQSTPTLSQSLGLTEAEEHVLFLEFADNSRGTKEQAGFSVPPSLTPEAVSKLVEKRNHRFVAAVNELISATLSDEDPALLLKTAAQDHIPVKPSLGSTSAHFGGSGGVDKMMIPDPENRPSIDTVIREIEQQEWYRDQIIERRIFEAQEAREGFLKTPLSKTIQQALKDSRKISSLHYHQAAAINALSSGSHVIVSTSTASGKSIIYQVPLMQHLEMDANATAVFIYPTKALAQDQKTALEQLLWCCPGLEHVKVATYDGDTPQEQRVGIRETASVIFTNFDMIHASILPHEDLWRRFLKNLKLVAVDELHYYSDLFGSHVAQVLRRFRRVCAAVGKDRRVRFISCSATISKPARHMERMFGIDKIEEITEDGAPSGRKDYLIWNPPPIDSVAPQLGRRSSLSEATGLMRFLMKRGIRVILFCKIRKVCELAMKTLRNDLSAEGRLDVLEKVVSYRGGYSQEDRRRIENDAFSGNILGIVATNALELGVDIGVLDAVIMLGFPIGIANFRQQAGRAGRRARDSLAVLVPDVLPIDQHYANNPDELFDKAIDDLVIDLDSKVILEAHLQCAAQEMPLSKDDAVYFGALTPEICETKLEKDSDGWYHPHPRFLPFPAKHITLRGADEEKYTVVDITKSEQLTGDPKIIEEVEVSRALFEIYEGAVFLHQGLTFIVKEISHDLKMAKIVRADVNWITSPRDYTNVDAVQTYRIKEIKGSPQRAFYGKVYIKTVVFGFFKIRNKTILEAVDVDMPPWERDATGLWLDVPTEIIMLMRSKGLNAAEGIHSAQHAFLNHFAMAKDLSTECKAPEKEYKATESQRKRPARLIFYDSAGRSGVSAKAFDHISDVLRKARETVETCSCAAGCPRCVQSPLCRENNEVTSKIGALLILRAILGLEVNADKIPYQWDEKDAFDTIVEAPYVRPLDGVQVERQ